MIPNIKYWNSRHIMFKLISTQKRECLYCVNRLASEAQGIGLVLPDCEMIHKQCPHVCMYRRDRRTDRHAVLYTDGHPSLYWQMLYSPLMVLGSATMLAGTSSVTVTTTWMAGAASRSSARTRVTFPVSLKIWFKKKLARTLSDIWSCQPMLH